MLYKSADPNKPDSNLTVGSGESGILGDKKLLGAAVAGLLGGAAGSLVAPDFVYKKPTWKNRLLLGAGTGVSSAAIVYATMLALLGQDLHKSILDQAKDKVEDWMVGKPTLQEIRDMGDVERSFKGLYGTGFPGWISRNFRARPYGSWNHMWGKKDWGDKEDPSFGDIASAWGTSLTGYVAPWLAGSQMRRALENRGRTSELLRLVDLKGTSLTPRAQHLIARLRRSHEANGIGEFLKASVAGPSYTLGKMLHKTRLGRKMWRFGAEQRMINSWLQTPGVRTSGGAPSISVLGWLQRHPEHILGNSKAIQNLTSANRWNKNVFKGVRGGRSLFWLTNLATLGLLGGVNSFKSNDPYERWLNDIGTKYKLKP